MTFLKGENPHHPKPGSTIKVDPIRDKLAIQKIKHALAKNPRNLCFFTFGFNTGYRASELLSIRVEQVRYLKPGDLLDVKQSKTKRYRQVKINSTTYESIQGLLAWKELNDDEPLFMGQRGLLKVSTVSRMVKTWCEEVGLNGHYGGHTLRKTWGYWQRMERNTPIPLLMEAFSHTTQQQTLQYLGIQSDEIAAIYDLEL